jgi:hypothetical protein
LGAEKRHMLNVEKSALRDLVQGAATSKHLTSEAAGLQFLAEKQGQSYLLAQQISEQCDSRTFGLEVPPTSMVARMSWR